MEEPLVRRVVRVEGEGVGGTSCVDPVVRRTVVRDAGRFCAGAGAVDADLCGFPAARTSVQWLHLVTASGNRTQASDSTSKNDCVTNETVLLVKHGSHRDKANVNLRNCRS